MTAPVTLKQRVIAGTRPGPHLLITGGVHGDEFEPMAAIRRLAHAIYPTSLAGRVTLVPVVNQSAFAREHRTGDDGLDLARTCPGRADGSITERIAYALSELIRAADYYIDLHTGGTQLSVYPLSGYNLHPDLDVRAAQHRMAVAFNLPVIWGTHPGLEGRSLSVARDANVPAIYAEYLGSATCDPAGVDAYFEGCLNVLGALGMIERNSPVSKVQYVILDDRPNSGHMQVCHPSPLSGYFEPAVRLGDIVHKGAPLGTVCDDLGEQVATIPADFDGIVLVLRTFSRIAKGASAGVVAELRT